MQLLARARLLIIADYDSDGATACAVGMRALREFGAIADYLRQTVSNLATA
jgi:single-stranded-DNA-specific exonuclease